jgi:transcriptional regulator with XRE-family HTH domain
MSTNMSTNLKEIGKRLQKERERNGLSQTDLGDILGVNKQGVSRWENGNASIPFKNLPILAEKGFDLQYIITGKRSEVSAASGLDARVAQLSPEQRDVLMEGLSKLEAANRQAEEARAQLRKAFE